MLLLILIITKQFAIIPQNSNTSYVAINQFFSEGVMDAGDNSNTSYVAINLGFLLKRCNGLHNSNTSYVAINQNQLKTKKVKK